MSSPLLTCRPGEQSAIMESMYFGTARLLGLPLDFGYRRYPSNNGNDGGMDEYGLPVNRKI